MITGYAVFSVSCALCSPGRVGPSASGRGVLSMQGLSYGVVRVDTPNSLTSLTLQDCGQVLPGGKSCREVPPTVVLCLLIVINLNTWAHMHDTVLSASLRLNQSYDGLTG